MVTLWLTDMSLSAFGNLGLRAMAIMDVRVLGGFTDLEYSHFLLQKVRYLGWYGCGGYLR